jgi:hypothetical protein
MSAIPVVSHQASAPLAATPRHCPRCDYDLAGAIAGWRDACPLRGTCSECGLDFAWRDIFDDRLSGPSWSFEHGRRWSWRRLLATASRAAAPLGMWRGIRLELAIVPARLVLIPCLSLLLFHLAFILVAIVELFTDTSMIAFQPWPTILVREVIPTVAWPYSEGPWFDGRIALLWFAWVGMQWAFMPLVMLILEETMRRVKVRRVHILRGACYSAPAALAATVAAAATLPLLALPVRPWVGLLIALIPTAWLMIWWHRFIARYLRLPQAALITAVMMGLSVFASFTFLFAGQFWFA